MAFFLCNRSLKVSFNRFKSVALCLVASSVVLTGCAGDKATQVASKRPKEYFSEKDYGVSASPRVTHTKTADVRKGGGVYRVGKPYKVRGKWYYPKDDKNYNKVGVASWYGDAFHGRLTANGEVYNMHGLSAAHPTLPLPSYVRVTNISNNKSVIVRVNDRGPFHANRVIDLSRRTAELLGTKADGIGKVRVQYVGRARMDGHDDWLMASYMENGRYLNPNARTIIARNMSGGSVPSTLLASNDAVSGRTISDVASASLALPENVIIPRSRADVFGTINVASSSALPELTPRDIQGIAPSVALTPFDANPAAASAPLPRGAPLDLLAQSRSSSVGDIVNNDLRTQAQQTALRSGLGRAAPRTRGGSSDQGLITRSIRGSKPSAQVQVGTFSKKDNAEKAAKVADQFGSSEVAVTLSSTGQPVYTVHVNANDGVSSDMLLSLARQNGFQDAILKQ